MSIDLLHDDLDQARADMLALLEAAGRVRVTKPGPGEPQLNYATGQLVAPSNPVVVYEGPGRIQFRADINSGVVEPYVGEREWAYETATLQIPVENTTDPNADWAGDPTHVVADMACLVLVSHENSKIVGREYAIVAGADKSHGTTQRLRVRRISG